VHAIGQTAHFDTQTTTVNPQKFYRALNAHLPESVRVYSSQVVADNFDACRTAKKKTYRYSTYLSEVENPIKERFAVRIDKGLNVDLMRECAKVFVGEHDFKCFNASGGGAKTTVRTIYNIEIIDSQADLKIRVSGNGCLYKMVRSLAGVLVLAGYGKLSQEDCEKILQEKRRSEKIKTLPAKGLTLFSVSYK
jgi:tRNA pseudouridine38-40 synthase